MAKRNGKPELRSAQEKVLSNRKLKVRKGYYSYQYDLRFGSNRPHQPPRFVPWIQIKGYWLNEVGFSIGSVLDVHMVQQGWIVLRVQPPFKLPRRR